MAEIWRCAASLGASGRVGEGVASATPSSRTSRGPNLAGHVLWCLGRVGARVPLFGPANTVASREKAERWTKALVDREFARGRETTDAIFSLSQLARVSGDRARDLDEDLRARVIDRLVALGAEEATIRPVREFTELEASQQGQALGDSLPVGLRLVGRASRPREPSALRRSTSRPRGRDPTCVHSADGAPVANVTGTFHTKFFTVQSVLGRQTIALSETFTLSVSPGFAAAERGTGIVDRRPRASRSGRRTSGSRPRAFRAHRGPRPGRSSAPRRSTRNPSPGG